MRSGVEINSPLVHPVAVLEVGTAFLQARCVRNQMGWTLLVINFC